MALFDFSKTTENHFHGGAPGIAVSGDTGNISNNTSSSSTALELFKIILTQLLAVIGGLVIAYFTYLFGVNGKPMEFKCYLPVQKELKSEVKIPQEKNKTLSKSDGSK